MPARGYSYTSVGSVSVNRVLLSGYRFLPLFVHSGPVHFKLPLCIIIYVLITIVRPHDMHADESATLVSLYLGTNIKVSDDKVDRGDYDGHFKVSVLSADNIDRIARCETKNNVVNAEKFTCLNYACTLRKRLFFILS